MTQEIEQTELQKKLKKMSWDELRLQLKKMTESEDYEICRMIQDEIDERVKNIPI